MVDSLPVCVIDAGIIIDMDHGGMVLEIFQLPMTFVAPDVVIEELIMPDGAELVRNGMISAEFSGKEVLEVARLRSEYRKPSTNDLFVLFLAKKMNALLLTGDANLKKAALEEGVTTHGIIWLFEKLVNHAIVPRATAASALEKILDHPKSRLPLELCNKFIYKWRKAD
ncbi:MAG: hypothetical protein HQK57_09765 [Deltaproteobacteria bacterium]|nr:hypothetical protein [Deltaproteobacteria bacterium]MBF0527207.1 hypothetical protein [Deltaproteobacteria bacterium]